MENFIQTVRNYKNAGYPALYIQTYEDERAEKVLSKNFQAFSWDVIRGMVELPERGVMVETDSPVEALSAAVDLPEGSILIMKDTHAYIESVPFQRMLKNSMEEFKRKNITVFLISPIVKIPPIIEKEIAIIEMPLPKTEEIEILAKQIVKDNHLDIKVDPKEISHGKGLTFSEAENAIALSIITKRKISGKVLEEQKMQAVKRSGLLEIYNPVPEEEIGGLEALKQYLKNRRKGFENPGLPRPRGILLLGAPGVGKSLSAKAAASILGFPLVRLDISALKSSFVGESEARMREALKLIDAISPVVVWIDEIEKAIGGVMSSNKTDGGTTSSMFGYLLTWMQESKSPKYVVATSNDINEILQISQGALIRRFDDVFFVDLPSLEERKEILKIMNRKYGTNIPVDLAGMMTNWTGAEIEKFVISSIYDGIEEALRAVKPIFLQNRDLILKARAWAKSNARIANEKVGKKTGRNLNVEELYSSTGG